MKTILPVVLRQAGVRSLLIEQAIWHLFRTGYSKYLIRGCGNAVEPCFINELSLNVGRFPDNT